MKVTTGTVFQLRVEGNILIQSGAEDKNVNDPTKTNKKKKKKTFPLIAEGFQSDASLDILSDFSG